MVGQTESEIFLKNAAACKPEELKDLLKQVEKTLEKSDKKDRNLLLAKTIITTRLASKRDQL